MTDDALRRAASWMPPGGGAVSDELKLSLQPERFRLRYSRAAASVHEALARLERPPQSGEIPGPDPDNSRPLALLIAACEDTGRAIEKVDEVIGHLGTAGDGLSVAVRSFLADIIKPSMQVLRAGALLKLRRLQASVDDEDDVEAEAQVAAIAGRDNLSWRVRYNVACYYASKPLPGGEASAEKSSDPRSTAFAQLEAALATAPRREATRLASWAERDPSLASLRTDEWKARVERLLRRYTVAEKPSSSLAELDGVGELGAEQLTRLGIRQPSDLPRRLGWSTVAKAAGVARVIAVQWVERVDLAAVDPLKVADVNALIRAGVRSTEALAKEETIDLRSRLTKLGETAPQGWTVPGLATLDHWIMAARRRLMED